MEHIHELKKKLCRELDEIARKGEMGAGDLELAHKLTDTIKNIDKIEMLEEDGGMSREGDYERGYSARRRRNSMGRFTSRDGGYSGRGYSRDGGYSRADAKEQMMEQMEELLGNASTERERKAIQRCMEQLEQE